MKILNDRKEIAKAMNFGKYPVIAIDIDKYKKEDSIVGVPCRVKWIYHEEDLFKDCNLDIYKDGFAGFTSCGSCLKGDFSSSDVIRMAQIANTPIIDRNQEIIISLFSTKENLAYCPVIVKTGSSINIGCQTVLSIISNDRKELTDFISKILI